MAKLNISAEQAVEFASKEEFNIGIHRNESIRIMLSQSGEIANYFRQMRWVVAHCAKETSFVATDNPLVLTPPPDYKPGLFHSAFGILTPGCEKIIPLGQSCCLFILDKGDEIVHREIDRARTRSVNKFVASKVNQYLIARDERLLSNLAPVADSGSRTRDGRIIIG